jgi:hypothetical protein
MLFVGGVMAISDKVKALVKLKGKGRRYEGA